MAPAQPHDRRDSDAAIGDLRAELRSARTELLDELRAMRVEAKESYVRQEAFTALADRVADIRRGIGWVQGIVGATLIGALLRLILEVKSS